MADRRAQASPRRQSWKGTAGVGGALADGRSSKVWRWVLSILALILFGVLVYKLWPHLPPSTYFVALEVGESNKLTAPPLPSDSSLFDSDKEGLYRYVEFHNWSHLLESTTQDKLADLAELPLDSKDQLVVYVCAHIVPNADHTAVDILCRDFDFNESARTRYPLRSLIDLMQRTPAATKLLVLDSGRIVTDARLGVLANDAHQLLEDELSRVDDPSFWVLLSNQPLEAASGWYGRRQTFFGEAVMAGLGGAADTSPKDAYVTLDELNDFVARSCAARTGNAQHPRLLSARSSAAPRLTDIKVLALGPGRASAAEEQEQEAKQEEQQEQEQEQEPGQEEEVDNNALPVAADESDQDEPADTADDSAVAAEPQADDDEDVYVRLLNQAWQLRDQLQVEPVNENEWTLIELMPHLCRELDSLLLDFELRYRGPGRIVSADLTQQLEKLVEGLTRLRDSLRQGARLAQPVGQSLVDRLAQTVAIAETKVSERATFDVPRLTEVAAATRSVQRTAFRAPHLVQWHGNTALIAAADDDTFNDMFLSISALLAAMSDYSLTLTQLDDVELDATREATLRQNYEAVDAARKDTERSWSDFLATLRSNADQPRYRCLIEATLGTNLPSAREREEMRSLLQLESTAPVAEGIDGSVAATWTTPEHAWQRMQRQSQLETLLARQADPQFDADRSGVEQRGAEARWSYLRQTGIALGTFYADLPSRLASADAERFAWLLRLVDGRDANRIASGDWQHPRLTVRPAREPAKLVFDKQPPAEIELQPQGTELSWHIKSTAERRRPLRILVDYDDAFLTIQDEQAEKIRPRVPRFAESGSAELRWNVTPATDITTGGRFARITLRVESVDLSPIEDIITCRRRAANEVELVVYHLAGDKDHVQLPLGRNGVELRPFPNRQSDFRFGLRNLSDQDKSVRVTLAAVSLSTDPAPPDVAPGRLMDAQYRVYPIVRQAMLGEDGRLNPQARVLGQTAEPIMLPADGSLQNLMLGNPPAAAAAAPTDAAAPAATPEKQEITYGMVCQITDEQDPTQVWIKWVEINPLAPRDFLSSSARYVQQQFSALVEAKSAAIFPNAASLAMQPVDVQWDTSTLASIPTSAVLSGKIKKATEPVELNAAMAARPNATALIRLDIDQYPRGFVYEVDLDGDNEGREISEDPNKMPIQITSLRRAGFNKMYLRAGASLPALPEGEEPPETLPLRGNVPVVFPPPDEENPLFLEFQVDVPSNSFLRDDPDDVITVGLAGRPASHLLYRDRQIRSWLDGVDAGRVSITSAVADHAIRLDLPRFTGRKTLEVGMTFRGIPQQPTTVDLIFDDTDPVIRSFVVPAVVDQNDNVPISLSVQDVSGIARIEVGFAKSADDPFAGKTVVKTNASAVNVDLPTKDLEPATQIVKVVVTDLVGRTVSDARPVKIQAPPPEVPPTFNVSGRVRIGSSYYPNLFTVTLKESDKQPVTTKKGVFSFTDVPAGEYVLEASGTLRDVKYEGTMKLKLLKLGDAPGPIMLQLERAK